MLKPISFRIPLAAFTAAVCSCAAPKAVVVEQGAPAVAEQESEKKEPEVQPEPAIAGPPDDGIRLPDMLTLPGENEFRKPVSSGNQGRGSGEVIARPPSE